MSGFLHMSALNNQPDHLLFLSEVFVLVRNKKVKHMHNFIVEMNEWLRHGLKFAIVGKM